MTVETDDDGVRRKLTPICPGIDRRIRAMKLARERGIKVQATVSPVLPHDCDRFTELLAQSADRVVIDTFVAGDGSQGRRTARRPLPGQFNLLGWGDWRDDSRAHRLYEYLIDWMGKDRVSWSSEGFNGL